MRRAATPAFCTKWHLIFLFRLENPAFGLQVFFHDGNLEPGDRFYPLLWGCRGKFRGAVGAIYRLNSSLKGNIIVLGNVTASDTVTETLQAQLLPRTFLIGMGAGVCLFSSRAER